MQKILGHIVPLKWIEYGLYGDLIIRYPEPYSIYLRGTIAAKQESQCLLAGVPTIRTIVYSGSYWGFPICGNCHVAWG